MYLPFIFKAYFRDALCTRDSIAHQASVLPQYLWFSKSDHRQHAVI